MQINLHTHLEGTIRPETAKELAKAAGVPEPSGGWERALRMSGPADLTVFLAHVAAGYPLTTTVEALERVAFEAVEDASKDGSDFVELRFGPWTHAGNAERLPDIVSAVARGAREGSKTTGTGSGVVVAILRHHSAEINRSVTDAAIAAAGDGVVGFDLAGDELLFPDLNSYAGLFADAMSAGLGITCHAAEAAPGTAARYAAETLGVRRIGHGVQMADDPEILRWAAGESIAIEVCPTSNWLTGGVDRLAAHPARRFADAGIPLLLGDDDPVTTGSWLSSERNLLVEQLGFTPRELADLDTESVARVFAAPADREELRSRLVAQAS